MHVMVNWEQPIYTHNVVDADRRSNSHFDIPNRIYLLNDVLQQTQILPYYGFKIWFGIEFIVFGK